MDIEGRLSLITRPPAQEVVTQDELRSLLETESSPRHYIGFEISGPLHLGSIVVPGYKIRDMMQAGVKATVFLADWHSVVNGKLDGDWEKITAAAKYYEEAFKLFAPGVAVTTGSALYAEHPDYWKDVIEFSGHVSLQRATRTITIMGRSMKESLDIGQFFYPPMQAVDIHTLGASIAHAGMDQRKVHMLAREVFPKMGWRPPVAVHHCILLGLGRPERGGVDEEAESDMEVSSKMSKSRPKSAIFIHDTPEEVADKLASAWCPPGEARMNPVLQYLKEVVFHEVKEFTVERPSKFGGSVTFTSYRELEDEYVARRIHPADLKPAVAGAIDKIIAPLRARFEGRRDELLRLVS
ncbi:MAG: tyrosine--tRNA ligase [Nitrososphaerota archaeon]|nr:tyrosine--tRNA ligase [Nitrososphaerota archaeon]